MDLASNKIEVLAPEVLTPFSSENESELTKRVERNRLRVRKALYRSPVVVQEALSWRDRLRSDEPGWAQFFESDELSSSAHWLESKVAAIEEVHQSYRKANVLRAKLISTPKSKIKQLRRLRWLTGRAHVQLSRRLHSLGLSLSGEAQLIDVIKQKIEILQPLQSTLKRLERKADHVRKIARKIVLKEIRTVKGQIAVLEQGYRCTASELKRSFAAILAARTELQLAGAELERLKAAAAVELTEFLKLNQIHVGELEIETPPNSRVPETEGNKTQRKYRSRRVDFLAVDELNRRLGKRGEALVVEHERSRLIRQAQPELAERVQCISESLGDGAGYDILSFELDGTERYVEVKTTNLGKNAPFMVSLNEVAFSEEHSEQYHLYRVFNLGRYPRLFVLKGSLKQHSMEAVQFKVTF